MNIINHSLSPKSLLQACGIEWLTCIFCCIPLCLCHTCIQPSLAQSDLNDAMFQINQAHFQGRSVCQCTSQYLVVTYESISPVTTAGDSHSGNETVPITQVTAVIDHEPATAPVSSKTVEI